MKFKAVVIPSVDSKKKEIKNKDKFDLVFFIGSIVVIFLTGVKVGLIIGSCLSKKLSKSKRNHASARVKVRKTRNSQQEDDCDDCYCDEDYVD